MMDALFFVLAGRINPGAGRPAMRPRPKGHGIRGGKAGRKKTRRNNSCVFCLCLETACDYREDRVEALYS